MAALPKDDRGARRLTGAGATNLPHPLTSFVGRATELNEIDRLLGESRLLTLAGPGGCGKTRLATEASRRRSADFDAGVWFVDLAAVDDPDKVVAAVAEVLAVRETAHRSLLDAVVATIGDASTLLILDNCEHVVASAAEAIREILERCGRVVVLATSREVIGCAGEILYRVPAMVEAVELFVDRARQAAPTRERTRADLDVIGEICAQLDAMPLAIELAAARTRLLTLEQIRAGLADQLGLLTAGDRTATARQRTLRASIEWSYALLGADERAALRAASVFVGGFTIDAITEVCEPGVDVLSLVAQLVDKSLVVTEYGGCSGRLGLLETVRQFALEQLFADEEVDRAQRRHLEYFTVFVQPRSSETEGIYLERLLEDYPNIQWALGYAVQVDRPALVAMVSSLARFWRAERNSADGARLCEIALGVVSAPADRAVVLGALCACNYITGDWMRALEAGTQATELWPEIENPVVAMRLTGLLSVMVDLSGTAPIGMDAALTTAERLGDDVERAEFVQMAAWFRLREDGILEGAATKLDESIAICSRRGLAYLGLYARERRALLRLWTGEMLGAREALDSCVDDAAAFGSVILEAEGLGFLAGLQAATGADDAADETLARLSRLAETVGILGIYHRTIGEVTVHLARGQWTQLETTVTPLIDAFGRGGSFWAVIVAVRAIARANNGDVAGATADIAMLGERDSNPWREGFRAFAEATLAHRRGDPSKAEASTLEMLGRIDPGACMGILPSALLLIASDALARRNRFEDAVRAAAQAEASADRVGMSMSCGLMRALNGPATEECRAVLGDERFNALWAEGSGLSFAATVAYLQRGRGNRKRPASGWDSLTSTEIQVVELVGEGATNPEIAAKLLMSVPTVKSHLTHVFAKLGITNRASLSAEVARRAIAGRLNY